MRQLLLVPYHRRLTIGSAKKNQVQSQQNTKGAHNKTLTDWKHAQSDTLPDSV